MQFWISQTYNWIWFHSHPFLRELHNRSRLQIMYEKYGVKVHWSIYSFLSISLECDTGFYGIGCAMVCSDHNRSRLQIMYEKYGVKVHWSIYSFLSISLECDTGFYGIGCAMVCSDHCVGQNNSCHHVNGTCDLGCVPGYQDALCQEGEKDILEQIYRK